MEHPAEVFLGILSFACREPCLRGFARAADGACHPVASDPTCDSGSPTYDSSPDTDEPEVELPLVLGDPIETVDGELEPYVEWLDAVVIDKTRAIVAGVSGWAWYDLENHVRLAEHSSGRTYRVAVDRDTQRAFFATRADRIVVVVVDVSTDTPTPVDLPGWVTEGFHEDISADGGVVLLGALDEGLVVMDSDLNRLTSPVLLDADGSVYRSYDTSALGGYAPFPLQILVDRQGRIVYMARQYNADAVRDAIEAALAR